MALWLWRHPPAIGAAGRCIGRTDLPVDRRKARRLAHRIRAEARRHGLPREVWTSPLARSAAVGRCLRGWGWRWTVDARLAEMDFGRWEGRPWAEVPCDEVLAWQHALLHHAPGGGESLAALAARARAFVAEAAEAAGGPGARLVVGHGGWINALCHVAPDALQVDAARWPAPPKHGALTVWEPR
jgi:alpha-ribazole phosphatase